MNVSHNSTLLNIEEETSGKKSHVIFLYIFSISGQKGGSPYCLGGQLRNAAGGNVILTVDAFSPFSPFYLSGWIENTKPHDDRSKASPYQTAHGHLIIFESIYTFIDLFV